MLSFEQCRGFTVVVLITTVLLGHGNHFHCRVTTRGQGAMKGPYVCVGGGGGCNVYITAVVMSENIMM